MVRRSQQTPRPNVSISLRRDPDRSQTVKIIWKPGFMEAAGLGPYSGPRTKFFPVKWTDLRRQIRFVRHELGGGKQNDRKIERFHSFLPRCRKQIDHRNRHGRKTAAGPARITYGPVRDANWKTFVANEQCEWTFRRWILLLTNCLICKVNKYDMNVFQRFLKECDENGNSKHPPLLRRQQRSILWRLHLGSIILANSGD